jgi:hypothetical protein
MNLTGRSVFTGKMALIWAHRPQRIQSPGEIKRQRLCSCRANTGATVQAGNRSVTAEATLTDCARGRAAEDERFLDREEFWRPGSKSLQRRFFNAV